VLGRDILEKLQRLAATLELPPDANVSAFADDCLNRVCHRYGQYLGELIQRAHVDEDSELISFTSAMDTSKDTCHDTPGPSVYIHEVIGLDDRTLPRLAEMGTSLLAAYSKEWPSLTQEVNRWRSLKKRTTIPYVGVVQGDRTVNQRLNDHVGGPSTSGAPVFGTAARFAHLNGADVDVSIVSRTLLDADDIGAMCREHGIVDVACLALAEPIAIWIFQTQVLHGRGGANVKSMLGSGFGHVSPYQLTDPAHLATRELIFSGTRGHTLEAAAMATKGMYASRPDIVAGANAVATGPRPGYTDDTAEWAANPELKSAITATKGMYASRPDIVAGANALATGPRPGYTDDTAEWAANPELKSAIAAVKGSGGGKIGGPKTKDEGVGIFELVPDQKNPGEMITVGSLMGRKCRDENTGMFKQVPDPKNPGEMITKSALNGRKCTQDNRFAGLPALELPMGCVCPVCRTPFNRAIPATINIRRNKYWCCKVSCLTCPTRSRGIRSDESLKIIFEGQPEKLTAFRDAMHERGQRELALKQDLAAGRTSRPSTLAVEPLSAFLSMVINRLCQDSMGLLLEMSHGVSVCRLKHQQFHGSTKYSFHSVRSFFSVRVVSCIRAPPCMMSSSIISNVWLKCTACMISSNVS